MKYQPALKITENKKRWVDVSRLYNFHLPIGLHGVRAVTGCIFLYRLPVQPANGGVFRNNHRPF